MRGRISSEKIQDYIEGRLKEDEEVALGEYFRSHPREAMRAKALRRQAQRFRRFAEDILDEPIPQCVLDILQRLRQDG